MPFSGAVQSPSTLGLFVDCLEDDYQTAVLCGVADTALEQGANVLCFAGGGLKSPLRSGIQRNRIFELAHDGNVDALMVMSGAIGNLVGPAGLAEFLERYRSIPTCSIAVPVPGLPSILVDNVRGMREAIEHLIDTHGFRKIAFIRGPEANAEAERRFRVYRDVIEAHGLAYDPGLVAVGDFHRPSGIAAVRRLLEDRNRRFDAIVAASDYMALGVIDALQTRGIRVPDDVAVVGFDDVDEARLAPSPLTTVRQPLYEQGLQAANMVLAMLRGVHVQGQVTLHTELVARRSCGCFSQNGASPDARTDPSLDGDFAVAFARRRERTLGEMEHALRGVARALASDWHVRILDEFLGEVAQPGQGRFLSELEDALKTMPLKGSDGSVWQGLISTLRHNVLACMSDFAHRSRAEDIFQRARLLVANSVERTQGRQRLEAERWVRVISQTNEAVITTFNERSLARAVADQLPRLGIRSCFLSLYEGGTAEEPQARLILAYDSLQRGSNEWLGCVYPARQLVPHGLFTPERNTVYIVEPLFFQDHQLGFMLVEMGPRQGIIYEVLRDQISAALKGAQLVQEVVDKDRERERLMQVLERRASELERAYGALQQNQKALLSAEKMASIGRLTASIAHEMNTPIAAVRASLLELERLAAEYRASVDDPEVTSDDHREIVSEMQQAITLAGGAAERAADFLRSVKNQTRDTGSKERIRFDAVTNIRDTLLLLGHLLRKGNCRVAFAHSADSIEIDGTPGRLGQVVTNLVTNAIDAMVPKGGGIIELELVSEPTNVVLRVADCGTGIPDDIVEKIWEPLFTTKPFGHGTGLGLTIVREIVLGEFGGTVIVSPRDQGGTLFTVALPAPSLETAL